MPEVIVDGAGLAPIEYRLYPPIIVSSPKWVESWKPFVPTPMIVVSLNTSESASACLFNLVNS